MPLVSNPVTIFLIVLLVILVAPVLLARLHIPNIVGMIAAGVVIGPWGLHILDDDSSFQIFGQVGLLYLMFLAGVEIDMYHLRVNLRRGVGFGLLTFLIPLALGIITSVWLLGLGWLTAVLLGAMYASHTLISYPIATRFGLGQTSGVLIAVVGTIVAMVGSLLVIAGVANADSTGTLHAPALLGLIGRLLLFVVGVLFLYPRLARWFFRRYTDRITQWIFVMALALAASWGAGRLGLEPVLGAFMAGLVLNRFITRGGTLMAAVQFVGNALFIPYFLIGVGMMVNLRVALDWDTLGVAAIMLAVALTSKWLPAAATARLFGLGVTGRRMLFGLTTAHTAVALAVVTLAARRMGPDGTPLFDTTMINATVLVILATCTLAPIATTSAARKLQAMLMAPQSGIAGEGEAATSTGTDAGASATKGITATGNATERPEATLVAVANPLTTASLIEVGLLVRPLPRTFIPSPLIALHVRDSQSGKARAAATEALRLASEAASGASGKPLETLQRYDLNTTTGIVNAAMERDVTQIVVGMHRRQTIVDSSLGFKIQQLLQATEQMVIVARCYMPLSTMASVVVAVPAKAQYEPGFGRWVRALGCMGSRLGCRMVFICGRQEGACIAAEVKRLRLGLRQQYVETATGDDPVLRATATLGDDDLLVAISSRPEGISHTAAHDNLPAMAQRTLGRFSMFIIYP